MAICSSYTKWRRDVLWRSWRGNSIRVSTLSFRCWRRYHMQKYQKLADLPVRHGGLSLSNPTTNSKEFYKSSTLYCPHLLSALHGRVQYRSVDNLKCQCVVMPEWWIRIEAAYKAKFKSEVDQFPQDTQRTLKRANKTGRWLSVMRSHVGRTILSSTEFRDTLMLRYARVPSNLPTSCDGCGESKKFDVNHALDCKKGWIGYRSTRRNSWRTQRSTGTCV